MAAFTLLLFFPPAVCALVGNTMKIRNSAATMNSSTRGKPACSRITRSSATIENHCHRVRRNLASRPGNRSKSLKTSFPFGLAGTQARIQATARNPAKITSTNIIDQFMNTFLLAAETQFPRR
jgi:hypothetical protein